MFPHRKQACKKVNIVFGETLFNDVLDALKATTKIVQSCCPFCKESFLVTYGNFPSIRCIECSYGLYFHELRGGNYINNICFHNAQKQRNAYITKSLDKTDLEIRVSSREAYNSLMAQIPNTTAIDLQTALNKLILYTYL